MTIAKTERGPFARGRQLEAFLIASAAIFPQDFSANHFGLYREIRNFYELYQKFDRSLLAAARHNQADLELNGEWSHSDLDMLISEVRELRPRQTIIASAYYGHPISLFCACAKKGLPLVTIVRKASPFYLKLLLASGIRVLPHGPQHAPAQLVAKIRLAQSEGFYPILMIDAPSTRGRHANFLGYKVRASRMIEVIANIQQAEIVPILSYLDRSGGHVDRPRMPEGRKSITQTLLDLLQLGIQRRPAQYRWRSDSILLSDPNFAVNTIPFIASAIKFREESADTSISG